MQDTNGRQRQSQPEGLEHGRGPRLSLVMIAKDEEANLSRALESAARFVDEIILVDTGSTDRTVEIAESHGAKVYHHPWQGDFSLHRNQALSYAGGDWCLQLDADEELDPATAPLLPRLIQAKDITAYLVEMHNLLPGGQRSVFLWPRLFRRLPGVGYTRRVHNQLDLPPGAKVARCELRIIHHGYCGDQQTMLAKHRRRQEMIQRWMAEEPDNWEAFFYACQAATTGSGRPEELAQGVQRGFKALELARTCGEKPELYQVIYPPLVNCLDRLGRIPDMIKVLEEWMNLIPQNPDPYYVTVCLFYNRRHWAEVLEWSGRFRGLLPGLEAFQAANPHLEIYAKLHWHLVLARELLAALKLGRRELALELWRQVAAAGKQDEVREFLHTQAAELGLEAELARWEDFVRQGATAPTAAVGRAPRRILALDPGPAGGFCLLEEGRLAAASSWRGEAGLAPVARALRQVGWSGEELIQVVLADVPAAGPLLDEAEKAPEPLPDGWRGRPEELCRRARLSLGESGRDCLLVDPQLALAAGAFFTNPQAEAAVLVASRQGRHGFTSSALARNGRLVWLELGWGLDGGEDPVRLNPLAGLEAVARHNLGLEGEDLVRELADLAGDTPPDSALAPALLRHLRCYWHAPFPCQLYGRDLRLRRDDPFASRLAATLLATCDRLVLAAAQGLAERCSTPRLCLGGELAALTLLQGSLRRANPFQGLFCDQESPALLRGLALFAWHQLLGEPRRPAQESELPRAAA